VSDLYIVMFNLYYIVELKKKMWQIYILCYVV